MDGNLLEFLAVALVSVLSLAFGIHGIRNHGRDIPDKEYKQIDVIFSWGQMSCGVIGIVF